MTFLVVGEPPTGYGDVMVGDFEAESHREAAEQAAEGSPSGSVFYVVDRSMVASFIVGLREKDNGQ